MKFLLFTLFFFTYACAAAPTDSSIPIENNHMRMEIKINNETNLGMAGITIQDTTDIKNTFVTFRPFGEGSIEFWSDRCWKSFSIGHSKNSEINIALETLMPNKLPTKCSYGITNRINNVDHLIIGYFGINYSKETKPLLIEIDGKKFYGTSWLQLRESKPNENFIPITEPKVLKIFPTSEHGKLSIKGCGISFPSIEFSSTPITIDLKDLFPDGIKVDDSCDYEITTSNFDNPDIESHMFMLNIYKYETSWLESPVISYSRFWRTLKIKFNNPYMAYISINNSTCRGNTCRAHCKKDAECIVRAITTSGRLFYGKVKNGKLLEVK